MTARSLVATLWRAAHVDGGRPSRKPAPFLRRAISSKGWTSVPFGDGDTKTAAPGTYRPVGRTCPASCPYLGAGCYAEGGNVRTHQIDAPAAVDAAIVGAAAAMVWAAITGRVARLHVSGDLGSGPSPDPRYVAELCAVAREVRRLRGGSGPVAWTYTHHADGPYRQTLADAGVHVRLSDRPGPDGAIVVRDRDHARELRAGTTTPIAVCPAQLTGTTCQDCRLCWTRPDLTIAFLAHGTQARKVGAMVSM